MAKLTAWLVSAIGVLLVLGNLNVIPATINNWIITIGVLAIGIGKLVRNYSKKK